MGRRVSKEGSGVISDEICAFVLMCAVVPRHYSYFRSELVAAGGHGVNLLATYILCKGALFVLLIVLVLAPGLLLVVTDGLHKKEFLNYARFVLWWVSLGVASSIGLGKCY
ncbi:hypothetical protein GUJ93_ZPchr0006g40877 [Zizania palustris]|uniref:Uncharacterized protein n=1 Tax=Zizania palustris TaxID=103762 RepID=A0A8J5SMY2_ZIZPA|nr:hypothetical protein GUJ93_ZPchr0006g40877 [Zizania palustris]